MGVSKGIAVHTIVLVIMMGLFAFIAFYLFYVWSSGANVEATAMSCTVKRLSYCTDWKANNYGTEEPWDWNQRPPLGCDNLEIYEPLNGYECEGLYKTN